MLDAALRTDLRLAVHAHRASERRRLFPPRLQVGVPGADHLDLEIDLDIQRHGLGLWSDLATAMVAGSMDITDRPGAWLTRVGKPTPHDLDAVWIPLIRRAFACVEIEPRCVVVVTKAGWYDPVSGDRAEWARLRLR